MKRRVYLYFILTFLLGAIAGAVGVTTFGWYRGYWRRGPDRQRILRYLTRELTLSTDQAKQVDLILEDLTKKTRDLRGQVDPQFRTLREESLNRTREVLNPEQHAKFDAMVRRHEERMKKRPPPHW